MAAACRGAVEAGGLTVAIIPHASPQPGYPNPWVRLPVFTGAGNARNAFNVLSSTLCVAIGGGPGTLSEIALALKNGVPVWAWNSWKIADPRGAIPEGLRIFDDIQTLLRALENALA